MEVASDPKLSKRDRIIINVLYTVGWVAVLIALGDIAFTSIILGKTLSLYSIIVCIAIAVAGLVSLGIASIWPIRSENRSQKLEYLSHENEDLGSAIRMMGWLSAWGRWYAAQCLANSHHYDEGHVMSIASSQITNALVNGHLKARGRRPGKLDYEDIPPTHWHSTVVHMIPDNRTIWKMILIPTGGAEFEPDGTVIGRDPAATDRTAQMQEYDSVIVSAREFENLWPRKDKRADAERKLYLKKAKKAGVDKNEIAKLRQD